MNEASGNITPELVTGSATAGQVNAERKAASWRRTTLQVIAGSAFMALCAHIALPLPWTPVPLTVQPFAVLLLGLLLGPGAGSAACALYLLEGAVGLPVFSPGGPLGIAHLLGPTGGYLFAYPAAAWLTGWLGTRTWYSRQLAAAVMGSAVILLAGGLWLSLYTHASLRVTLLQAVVPFLPGDALKCVAAAAIAAGWMRWKPQQ